MQHPLFNRRDLAIVCALAAACLAVYGRLAGYGFVNFDDDLYVYQNVYTQAGVTAANLWHAFTATNLYYWHPLSLISHMLDFEWFGLDAGGHHSTSLAIHIFNSVLVYVLLRRTTGAVWRSAMVAALFAVHPLHVESVAWISERKDLLCGFFSLLTLVTYGWYARRPSAGRMLAVAAGFVCALMSKPMAVTLPFVMLLMDDWPLNRFRAAWKRNRALYLALEKVPLVLLALADSIATAQIQQRVGATTLLGSIPIPLRIGNALVACAQYLGRTLWPRSLSVLYIYRRDLGFWEVGAAALLLAAVTSLVVWGSGRRPYLAAGWFWFLGGLVPTLGLVQVGFQASADRFVYLPETGLFILLVWGGADLVARLDAARLAAPLAGAVLVVLATLSWVQTGYWRDGETLFRHTVAVTSGNYVAETLLGSALMQKDKPEEAIPHFQEAVRIEPAYALASNDLGAALALRGRYDEAFPNFERAARLAPGFGPAHFNLGVALMRRGQNDEALAEFRLALTRDIGTPYRFAAYNSMGTIRNNRGGFREAIDDFEHALALDATSAEACKNLAGALFNSGRREDAIARMLQCVALDPRDADAAHKLEIMKARRFAK